MDYLNELKSTNEAYETWKSLAYWNETKVDFDTWWQYELTSENVKEIEEMIKENEVSL